MKGSAFLEGNPDTVIDRRFPDGRLASRETYRNGRKVGVHWTFWPGGGRKRRAPYASEGDAYEGRVLSWDESGRLRDVRRYRRGREEGLQQSYGFDGTLFLNYEVRNGRRYGLVNSTPCLDAGHFPGRDGSSP
jgi:antitoxin component YwqK of YwqJK toxin-antitoxin module